MESGDSTKHVAGEEMLLADPGDLLTKAWNIYANHSRILVGTLVLTSLFPFFGALLWAVLLLVSIPTMLLSIIGYIILFMSLAFVVWGHAAIVYASMHTAEIKHISDAFYRSFPSLGRFFLSLVLVSLIIFGGFLVVFTPVLLLYSILGGSEYALSILSTASLGAILLFMIVLPIWFIFVPYLAIQTRSMTVFGILRVSHQMVQGIWWRVFWRIVFIFIIVIIVDTVIILIPAVLGISDGSIAYDLFRIADMIALTFMTPLISIYGYLLYRDVKKVRFQHFEMRKSVKVYPAYIPPAIVGGMMIIALCLMTAWAIIVESNNPTSQKPIPTISSLNKSL